MRLNCATLLTALLVAISVFIAEVGKTEYKSQMRKRKQTSLKAKKTEQVTKIVQNGEEFEEADLEEDL